MPMDFPDLNALKAGYDHETMVPYKEGETEDQYRERCAVWVETVHGDHIEAQEVRTKKGWNKWGEGDQKDLLRRRGFRI